MLLAKIAKHAKDSKRTEAVSCLGFLDVVGVLAREHR
jgi:hypothetical protein